LLVLNYWSDARQYNDQSFTPSGLRRTCHSQRAGRGRDCCIPMWRNGIRTALRSLRGQPYKSSSLFIGTMPVWWNGIHICFRSRRRKAYRFKSCNRHQIFVESWLSGLKQQVANLSWRQTHHWFKSSTLRHVHGDDPNGEEAAWKAVARNRVAGSIPVVSAICKHMRCMRAPYAASTSSARPARTRRHPYGPKFW
jgi:hypothetical protein